MFAACLSTHCKRIYNTLSSKVRCKGKQKMLRSSYFFVMNGAIVQNTPSNFTKMTF